MIFSSCWFLISVHVCIWKVTVFYVKVFLLENKILRHDYCLWLSLKLAIFTQVVRHWNLYYYLC